LALLITRYQESVGRFWAQCKNKDSAHSAASLQDVNGKPENIKHKNPSRAGP